VYVLSAIDVTTPPPAPPPPPLLSSPPLSLVGVPSLVVVREVVAVVLVVDVVESEGDREVDGAVLEGGGCGVVEDEEEEEEEVVGVVVVDVEVVEEVEVVEVVEEVDVLDDDDVDEVVLLLKVGGVGSSTISVCIVKIKPFSSVVVCVRASGAAPRRRASMTARMLRSGKTMVVDWSRCR
jgi:hypothetical protein